MDGSPVNRRCMPAGACAAGLALGALLALAPPAGAQSPAPDAAPPGEPASATGPPAPPPDPPAAEGASADIACRDPGSDGTAMVDRVQKGVYASVCGTARWFDGLFGTRRYDQDSDDTFGRVGLTALWDDRDGFDEKLRMRVRLALPAMEERLRLFFGRADEREVIEDQQAGGGGGQVPSSFQRVEDESWLLGLGYSRQGSLENGFDFGAGIRIRSPVDPFAKGTYRHNWALTDATAVRARQTVFWRDSRGLGETTELDIDHLLTPKLLLRWDNAATLADDVGRLEWGTQLILFQNLGPRRGLAYTGFLSGVANTDVPIRNYGTEVRYRRQIYRRWLFLEGRASVSWPKELPEEERKINPGVALGVEMYFGPVPENQLR